MSPTTKIKAVLHYTDTRSRSQDVCCFLATRPTPGEKLAYRWSDGETHYLVVIEVSHEVDQIRGSQIHVWLEPDTKE